ncbi:MAG TPA: flagellar assembly protein FliW [Dissulfurispiraceae bacterium]|nr:flagellar assembly protein FliW [Dissulfurispiraceae bacterium]
MKIATTRFGEIEVAEDRFITFPLGIPGFDEQRHFVLLEHKDNISWLQAVDEPDLAFIVTEPFQLFPDYAFKVSDDMEKLLFVDDPRHLLVLAIIAVSESGATVNLRAPLLVNTSRMLGAQILSDDESLSFRTPFPKAAR